MKQKMLFLALIGAILAPQTLHAKVCVNPVSVVCPRVDCGTNVVHISQADVGPGGLVLDTPGTRYCFVESITWAPPVTTTLHRSVPGPSEPIAAITITASNIELDLNGYTLQQAGNASYAVGIYVTNGTDPSSVTDIGTPLNNIIVRNGNIQNIQTAGILVNKANEFLLEDLYITNNGASGYILCPCGAFRSGGIVYVSFTPDQIPAPFLNNHTWRNVHCDLNSDINSTEIKSLQGADISAVDGAAIENCTFNNNSSTLHGVVGIELLTNTDLKITDCQANSNSSVNEVAEGFFCSLTNFTFENCQANSNSSVNANVFGFGGSLTNFIFENCQANSNSSVNASVFGFTGSLANFIFENCQANSNTGLVNATGFNISPFFASGVINGVFSNCQANGNNIAGDGSTVVPPPIGLNIIAALGFSVLGLNLFTEAETTASGITFSNCVANNQTSTVSGFTGHNIHAYGYFLEFVTDVQVDKCIACLNTAYSVPGLGDGEGFFIDGYDVTLTNCRAEYNRGIGGVTNSEQYDLFPFIAGISYNNNIINCTALGDPNDPYGVGIYALNPNNCVIEGCLIESNVYDGILIDRYYECPYESKNVIKHNQILAPDPNVFGGPTGRWAIEDLSAFDDNAPVNVYYDNYAFNYPGNGVITNYNTGVRLAGPVDPVYIWRWDVPGGPISYTGAFSKISNVDVVYGSCVD